MACNTAGLRLGEQQVSRVTGDCWRVWHVSGEQELRSPEAVRECDYRDCYLAKGILHRLVHIHPGGIR